MGLKTETTSAIIVNYPRSPCQTNLIPIGLKKLFCIQRWFRNQTFNNVAIPLFTDTWLDRDSSTMSAKQEEPAQSPHLQTLWQSRFLCQILSQFFFTCYPAHTLTFPPHPIPILIFSSVLGPKFFLISLPHL